MAGYQICEALKALDSSYLDDWKLSTLVQASITWFYDICRDRSYYETTCTAWVASSWLRIFASNSNGSFAENVREITESWKEKDEPFTHPLPVCILRMAAKMNSRDYNVKLDFFADRFYANEMIKLERVVINVLQWKLLVSSPHDFLHVHIRDFNLSESEFNQAENMLICCAKAPELCGGYSTGSLVLACIVILRTATREHDVLGEYIEMLASAASITDLLFQRITDLSDVQSILNDHSSKMRAYISSSRGELSPSTIGHSRQGTTLAKRRFCQPLPSMRETSEDTPFPHTSYESPNPSTKRPRIIIQTGSS